LGFRYPRQRVADRGKGHDLSQGFKETICQPGNTVAVRKCPPVDILLALVQSEGDRLFSRDLDRALNNLGGTTLERTELGNASDGALTFVPPATLWNSTRLFRIGQDRGRGHEWSDFTDILRRSVPTAAITSLLPVIPGFHATPPAEAGTAGTPAETSAIGSLADLSRVEARVGTGLFTGISSKISQ